MFLRLNNTDLEAFTGGTADLIIQDREVKIGIERIWVTENQLFINSAWGAEISPRSEWQRVDSYTNRTLPYNNVDHLALEPAPGKKKLIRCICEQCKENKIKITLTPPDKHGSWSFERACGVISSSDPQQ